MSAVLVAVALAAAVLVAVAPPGAVARCSLRRRRPEVAARTRRAGGRGPDRSGPVDLRAVVGAASRVGRPLRRLAGRPPDPVEDRRLGGALLAGAGAALVVSPVVAPVVTAVVWVVPVVHRRSRRTASERAVRAAVPDTVDLFRLAVGAGLSVHQAVDAVGRRAPAPVDATFAEVRRRLAMGARLGDALDALDALGDPALPLAGALRGAARYGSPLSGALERVATDARLLRRRRAEEDARRLPVQLLFPLVLCVLPAFGLLAVVPLVAASLRSLQL